MEETRAFRKDIEMTDKQVIESFDNAWRAFEKFKGLLEEGQ